VQLPREEDGTWADKVREAEALEERGSLRDRFLGSSRLNPFAVPFSPASSYASGAGRVSLTNSEASEGSEPPSPPVEGRGKQAALPRRCRGQAPPACGAFLADARCSYPW